MDLEKKYDEYDNIVTTLDNLIDNTEDEYFLDILKETKFEAQDKRDKIQEILFQEEEKELFNQNKNFQESRL